MVGGETTLASGTYTLMCITRTYEKNMHVQGHEKNVKSFRFPYHCGFLSYLFPSIGFFSFFSLTSLLPLKTTHYLCYHSELSLSAQDARTHDLLHVHFCHQKYNYFTFPHPLPPSLFTLFALDHFLRGLPPSEKHQKET